MTCLDLKCNAELLKYRQGLQNNMCIFIIFCTYCALKYFSFYLPYKFYTEYIIIFAILYLF